MDLHYCRQFARSSLDNAQRYNAEKSMRYKVPDELRSATLWAIEYWLITHDHQPDTSNGWYTLQYQFIELVPRDDPAYDLSIVVQLASTANGYYLGWPEEGPPPPEEALSLLLQRAAAAIEAVIGK